MQPDEILKVLYTSYKEYWTHTLNITHAQILQALNKPRLREANVTRLLTGATPKLIAEALAQPKSLSRLEKLLRIDGLFDVSSADDLHALMEKAGHGAAAESGRLKSVCVRVPGEAKSISYTSQETHVLKRLASYVNGEEWPAEDDRMPSPIIYWSAPLLSGAALMVHAVAEFLPKECRIKKMIVIRPASKIRPYQEEMRAVAQELGLHPASADNPGEIFRALKAQSTLLVINFAFVVPKQMSGKAFSAVLALIRHVKGETQARDQAPALLIAGELALDINARDVMSIAHLTDHLAVRRSGRFPTFCEQYDRFLKLRKEPKSLQGSVRIKRARWHYQTYVGNDASLGEAKKRDEYDHEIMPITIRLRAFCASNKHTLSYIDPTSGFRKLAGNLYEDLPIDIELAYWEIRAFIESFEVTQSKAKETTQGKRPMQVLRWVSTGVYWLTDGALEVLGKKAGGGGKSSEPANIDKVISRLDGAVKVLYNPWGLARSSERAYICNLAIKSIVQDDWLATAAYDRALAHFHIAHRLFTEQNHKDLLEVEFPLTPHWGRSRIHFLSECIRHLVRACEGVDLSKASPTWTPKKDGFVHKPDSNISGCNPYEVWAFCFEKLFREELNGQKAGKHARTLLRRHGAYHLNAEILQLLSEDEVLGSPHRALPAEYHNEYYKEVAYALLDLGRLEQAQTILKKLAASLSVQDDSFAKVDALLDLALISSIRGNLSEAERHVVKAEKLLSPKRKRIPGATLLRKRLWSRRFQLLYLQGNYSQALAEFRDKIGNTPPKREVAHYYIACLGQLGGEKNLNQAMAVCVKNLFFNTSAGNQHEALGFRIALSHLYRRKEMYDAAEAVLDQAYIDIVSFGCSERTYISFLLEAGRVLAKQERALRAYGLYIRPCLERAILGGFARERESAAEACHMVLKVILVARTSCAPGYNWEAKLRKEFEHSGLLKNYVTPNGKRLLAEDPHFSFDANSGEIWIDSIRDLDAIDKELKLCEKFMS